MFEHSVLNIIVKIPFLTKSAKILQSDFFCNQQYAKKGSFFLKTKKSNPYEI